MMFLIRLRPPWGGTWWRRRAAAEPGDAGMATAEYAIGTLAAAALAGVLYAVVTGRSVVTGLTSLVQRAITVKP